nr:gliding motility-associated C-terminal domain-containing protein [Saprospiraceae bacterium]
GCSNVDFIDVDFKPGPSVTLNDANIEICEGESFQLEATTTATKIEWLRNGQTIAGQTGKTLSITQAGTYTIKATGNVGGGSECTVEETATVVVNPKLAVSVNDTTACEGEVITLTSNVNAFKYTWKLGTQVVGNAKTFKPTAAGTYILEVETQKGCKSSDNIVVTFSARPSVLIPATGEYCKGQQLEITGQSNGNKFRWLQNGTAIANATSLNYTVKSGGTFVLEASFNGACPRTDTIVVTERPVPVVNLGNDKTLCPKDSVVLDAGNAGAAFVWSNGATSQKVTIKNSGIAGKLTLNLTVTNNFGCSSTDVIEITNRPVVNVTLNASAPGICGGDSVTITAAGGLNYAWEGPLGTFDLITPDKIVVYPAATSTYRVIASDDCPGNRDTATREVKIFTLPTVSAGGDTCVIKGRSIKLKASGGAFYTWQADESIVSGANTSSPVVMPEIETTYFVQIKDANGCIQFDSVAVCIIEDPLSLLKQVDAITPNEDGFNDQLEFIGLEAFPDNSLIIYNRWGSIVYEKLRYQSDGERFDGTRNGEQLPPDTYYYVLKFDEFVFKSALTIVREK